MCLKTASSNNLSLKYQGFTPSGCKDLGILKRHFMFILTVGRWGKGIHMV